jgi:hypothetical protein
MRAILGWVTFGAALVVAIALGVGAYLLATYSWNQIVDYDSPFAQLPLPAATSGSSIASTTVLVIVDGLSSEASLRMTGLNRLRQYGIDMTLTAPQPSLSYPNWTTILTGAPPDVSGVTTNWFSGHVPVETLLDTASRVGVSSVVVGPEDFGELYGADKATASYLRSYPTTFYASTELVDKAVSLVKRVRPRIAVLHLPDIDNAGHEFGGASDEYAEVVRKTDVDIGRLVEALQGEGTAFAVVADHGHVASGGHGGWETSVVNVPGVFFGEGLPLAQSNALLQDVAPTVALIAGVPSPRFAKGEAIPAVVGSKNRARLVPSWNQRVWFANEYAAVVTSPTGAPARAEYSEAAHGSRVTELMDSADDQRLAFDRKQRLWLGLAGLGASLVVLLAIGIGSWRALVAASVGAAAYFTVYNGLYFVVHGYRWSLSSFNEETLVQSFFNGRMVEAAVAGLLAAAVAGVVYPLLRQRPKGPRGPYLSGWLTLGPATILVVLALLGMQVAWFVWAWGVRPVWSLPDLRMGFKYDLDLIQATALAAAALLSPLVTVVVGRYHPRVRRASGRPDDTAGGVATPVRPLVPAGSAASAKE